VGSLGSRILSAIVIALSCASLAGCSPQSDGGFHAVADATPNAAAIQPQPASASTSGPNAAAIHPQPTSGSSADYHIASGDVLQITVFQIPDFNRDAQVDAAGNVFLPLIGGVPAAGKTEHEVETEIARRLQAKYLQNPQVLVTIKDAVGLRVSVQGAVKSPGVIQIRGDTTLTTVLAQVGGFTDTADKSSVLVVRNNDQGQRVAGKMDAGAILAGTAPDPRIYGGDTIEVDDSFIRSAGKDALQVLGGAAMLRVFFP
jgi:polysaccharide export outer membrane protein